jgi:hypothetical protein
MLKWFAVLLLILISAVVCAAPVTLQSPTQQLTLLELYTSEGCSSCPAADRWMSQLKNDPRLWRQIIPVAFHVDYWDYIGWPDRFASAQFSQRQRYYAQNGYVKTVYTPGLILNGQEWRRWFNDPTLQLPVPPEVGSLRLDIDQGQALASFSSLQLLPPQLELHLATLGFELTTAVQSGENRGRQLIHDFAVLGYKRVLLARQGERYLGQVTLPESRYATPRMGLAAWLSLPNDPRPLQVVGGWLQP